MPALTASIADQTWRNTATDTLTVVPTGTPAPDRVSAINIGPNSGISALSINGLTAQFLIDTVVANVVWGWVLNPLGTTATIVATGSAGFDCTGIWQCIGDPLAKISLVQGTLASAFPISSPSFNLAAGDALIGGVIDIDSGAPTLNITAGLTPGTQFTDSLGDFFIIGAQNYAAAVASQVVTATRTGGGTIANNGVTVAQLTSPSPNGRIIQARQSIERASYW